MDASKHSLRVGLVTIAEAMAIANRSYGWVYDRTTSGELRSFKSASGRISVSYFDLITEIAKDTRKRARTTRRRASPLRLVVDCQ